MFYYTRTMIMINATLLIRSGTFSGDLIIFINLFYIKFKCSKNYTILL